MCQRGAAVFKLLQSSIFFWLTNVYEGNLQYASLLHRYLDDKITTSENIIHIYLHRVPHPMMITEWSLQVFPSIIFYLPSHPWHAITSIWEHQACLKYFISPYVSIGTAAAGPDKIFLRTVVMRWQLHMADLCDDAAVLNNNNFPTVSQACFYWSWKHSILHLENKTSQ